MDNHPTIPNLRVKTVWNYNQTDKNTAFEIVLWDVGSERRPQGIWNYYIYLYEQDCLNFESLLIKPEVRNEYPPGWVCYPCSKQYEIFKDLEITRDLNYYRLHGEVPGFRSIQIGCDYDHLWDEGRDYSLNQIFRDALQTATQAKELYYKK